MGWKPRKPAGRSASPSADASPAFDPLQVPVKVLPTRLEDATPGGLGLVLIRNYTDEVRYARVAGRNCLTLVFRLAAPGTPPPPAAV
ncbi:MAG: ATP-binding protein [Lacunisphaera sp.]